MLDAALDHQRALGDGPVWRPVPEHVRAALRAPLPLQPEGPAKVCDDFRRLVLPYATGNAHPRFFGWVHGCGTPGGMLAEMLAGALNANLGGRDHGAIYVERQVIEWSRQIFGFPESASGLLVSGTSMATLIGLTVARNHSANGNLRKEGFNPAISPLVGYASAEAHSSVAKAFEILGLGRDRLRAVPVDVTFRMDCDQLEGMITRDWVSGSLPFCVIGTAGTVNTGAIDDLTRIADICRRENMWFHIDGAFGAAAMLSETQRHLLWGIERADSLAFDFHKWFHVPYDAGCILVRNAPLHREAFSARHDYLAAADRGLAGGNPWFCEFGPELSRGFRALKVWFTLKEHGTRRLGAKIDDNCRQARYLARCVERHPNLELMAPVALNIVCFRFRRPGLSGETLNRISQEIVITLQERGIAAPSTTRLEGSLAIRVNLTNHRCRQADLDALLEAALSIGATQAEAAGEHPFYPMADDFHLAEAPVIESGLPDRHRAMIAMVCRRPELRPLMSAVSITVDPELGLPFRVLGGTQIVLGPTALTDPSSSALLLRHALELALLQRLTPDASSGIEKIVIGLLACHAAALYSQLMIEAERNICDARLPDWLGNCYSFVLSSDPLGAAPRELASVLQALLQLQGVDTPNGDIELQVTLAHAAIRKLFHGARSLAAPAEHLLASGGDARLALDSRSGLNAYGCSPRPRPWAITFASSTATSISDLAYRDVERMRQDLIAAALVGDGEAALRGKVATVKRSLLAFCGASDLMGTEVILSTSGTDAELFTLYFALRKPTEKLVNIVIAPDETGSGVVDAARGWHFAATTPFGATVEAGKPLRRFAQGRVRLETVAARHPDGDLKPMAEIDRDVEHLVEAALAKGAHCLLHLLDCSKTGWSAPSLELLGRLPDSVDVVVDACQMRIQPETLRAYLDAGYMVQITGSKFFTGPPFSGALVLPPAIGARARRLDGLPASFRAYTGRLEWPEDWDRICHGLTEKANLGLLARWTAAIWEMKAFHAVPQDEQIRILAEFGDSVQEAMAANDVVELCVAPNLERFRRPAKAWDRRTTIFPFIVLRPTDAGERVPLSYDDARQVYRWLNQDISHALPDGAAGRTRRIAAMRCHIGQPVKIFRRAGVWIGALRLCAGARIVSGVTFDPTLGASPTERLRREIDDARLVLDKIGLIVKHWPTLEAAGETPLGTYPAYQG